MSQEHTVESEFDTASEVSQWVAAQADSIESSDSATARIEIVDNVVDELGKAIAAGVLPKSRKMECVKVLCNADEMLTQPTVTPRVDKSIDEHTPESQKDTPLDQWLRDNLEQVEIVKDRVTRQTKQYRWHFDPAALDAPYVETEDQHKNWDSFRSVIEGYDEFAGLEQPTEPRRGGADWVDYIQDILQQYGKKVDGDSPRGNATEGLLNSVRGASVYADKDRAWTHGNAVYHPDEDDPEDSEYLYVPVDDISKLVQEYELNHSNVIQSVLEARGIIDKGQKVSVPLSMPGSDSKSERWWRLPVEEFEDDLDIHADTEDGSTVALGEERATAGGEE